MSTKKIIFTYMPFNAVNFAMLGDIDPERPKLVRFLQTKEKGTQVNTYNHLDNHNLGWGKVKYSFSHFFLLRKREGWGSLTFME